MARVNIILDGLQDPVTAQQLSRQWAAAGLNNSVDPSGQSAWIEVQSALPELDRAAAIARWFGLEMRDRIGAQFQFNLELTVLRRKMEQEYRQRLATALVFGLPALALHYLGPILAGGGERTRALFYPWLMEMLLVGWACVAAGGPILWQGALALRHRTAHSDLLTSLLLLGTWTVSAVGVMALIWRAQPLCVPMFHSTLLLLLAAVGQRWLAYRYAEGLAGHATLLVPGAHYFGALWVGTCLLLGAWPRSLALGMVWPPMLALGGVNRWSPGWRVVLPVLAFCGLLTGALVTHQRNIVGVEVEIAGGFAGLMTAVLGLGWRGMASNFRSRG